MTNRMNIKAVLLLLIAIISLCFDTALSQQNDNQNNTDAGRDDPFAKLFENSTPTLKKVITKNVQNISSDVPPLYVESIALNNLDSQSLKTAIENMLSKYGSISTDRKTNSLIICDAKDNLERILNQIAKIDQNPKQIMFAQTVPLKFLEAKNLKAALDNMTSKYGSIAIDSPTNSLIVCDIKPRLEKILKEIKKADQTPQQIMIEVVILDVQLDDDTEIGVNWDDIVGNDHTKNYKQTLVDNLVSSSSGGAAFGLIESNISVTIHSLQQKRNVEILASPRVLVVSGQEAFIQTIEEIPYEEVTDTSQGGAAALTSTEFKEVGVTLKVKATVIDHNQILMTIEPEQSVDTGEFGIIGTIPIIDKRTAKTTLLMKDGQVVVMGGLRRKETKITKDQVPLLGDLPLIGFLFSSTREIVIRSELLVLISPHINGGQPLTKDQQERFNELRSEPPLKFNLKKGNHFNTK